MVRRLHVTHGYSRPDWPRVIWAVFVDLMAFAMVMWAITGVAMWWQKKSLRVAGGAVIAAAFGGGLVLTHAAFRARSLAARWSFFKDSVEKEAKMD